MSTVQEAKGLEMSGRGFKMLLSEFLLSMIKGNTAFYTRGIAALLLLIFANSTTSASTRVSVEEFNGKNQAQLRASTIQYKGKFEALQLQQASGTTINVGEITKTMLTSVDEGLKGTSFDSPVKKTNRAFGSQETPEKNNLRQAIKEITIDIDSTGETPVALIQKVQEEFLNQLFLKFKQYVERKQGSTNSGECLTLTVKNKNSPVRIVEVDVDSIFRAFKLAALGVLDPNIANLLKDCQLQVVVPGAVLGVASPVLNLQEEGKSYVNKIKAVIDEKGTLYNIVQQYRYESDNDHVMLMHMLSHNTEESAKNFRPSKKATMIEGADELRDCFFNTAFLTFIHYISGNANNTNVGEIIALTSGGRGVAISPRDIASLNQELEQIFYSRRESSSLTITQYEFRRPRETSAIGGYLLGADTAVNALVEAIFGNCMAPSRNNLLTNGNTSTGSNLRQTIGNG